MYRRTVTAATIMDPESLHLLPAIRHDAEARAMLQKEEATVMATVIVMVIAIVTVIAAVAW
jgi:hypothetical protein